MVLFVALLELRVVFWGLLCSCAGRWTGPAAVVISVQMFPKQDRSDAQYDDTKQYYHLDIMKLSSLLVALAALVVPSLSQATDSRLYKSDPEAIFCTSKLSAKSFQRYMRQKDVAAAGSVIQSGGCSIVTPSVELFIESEDEGVVGVRRKGLTSVVWTFKHMIR